MEPFTTIEAAIECVARSMKVDVEIVCGRHLSQDMWWDKMWEKRREIVSANMKQTTADIDQQERAELARLQAKYGRDN